MKESLFRLQYEFPHVEQYSEQGSESGAKMTPSAIEDPRVRATLEAVAAMGYKEALKWMSDFAGDESTVVLPLTTRTPEALDYRLEHRRPALLMVSRPLHTIERLDEYLDHASLGLEQGAILWCHSMTAVLKRKLIMNRYPWGVAHAVLAGNYLWHRVCPKLRLTHKLYFRVTGGKSRLMNRVEVMGRIARAGFEVIDEQFRNGEFFVVARKVQDPVGDNPPTGSPIIHLSRIGLGGREIVVHKFRTMYAYSEYIQAYVYHYQSLERGGKFRDDYRVTPIGRVLRRLWIDELPMLWNLLRGDIKLVGVRPLSRQYFSLYSPEMQALRVRTKPGLLPPFYYDDHTPNTIEDVQASERRYIEAYLKRPFATDWRYFWGIVGNILFRRRRSK